MSPISKMKPVTHHHELSGMADFPSVTQALVYRGWSAWAVWWFSSCLYRQKKVVVRLYATWCQPQSGCLGTVRRERDLQLQICRLLSVFFFFFKFSLYKFFTFLVRFSPSFFLDYCKWHYFLNFFLGVLVICVYKGLFCGLISFFLLCHWMKLSAVRVF